MPSSNYYIVPNILARVFVPLLETLFVGPTALDFVLEAAEWLSLLSF